MPWTGDPVWLPDVLRAEGLSVVEHPGWRERGHGDMGNLWGVVAHHTGNNPPSNNPGYIANHPSLGLCSQLHLSRDGVYTICGAGVAWHAGSGRWPGIAADNANQVTIGIEAENNGTEGWSPRQYDAYVRGVAAILRKLGYNSDRVIGHKEWAGASQGKWDPGGIDMNQFRAHVQARINSPAGGTDMALTDRFKNFEGRDVDLATAFHWMDKRLYQNEVMLMAVLDQLLGPDAGRIIRDRSAEAMRFWSQDGGRSLNDLVAAIGQKVGVDGAQDVRARDGKHAA